MIRRALLWLKWTLLSILALLLLVLALVSALVATEIGSHWVLGQVADRLPLEFGEVDGDLLRGLDISYLEYAPEPVGGAAAQRYRVEGLEFRWQPLALLYTTVSVQSLNADSVRLIMPPGEEASEEPAQAITDWPSLALPVRIELDEIQLNDIEIVQGETTTELQQISGSLSLGTFNLRVKDLKVLAADYSASATGRIGLRYPYPADLQLDWRYQLPQEQGEALSLSGVGQLTGDIEILTLEHRLAEPMVVQSNIRFQPALDNVDQQPRLGMDSNWDQQSPPASVWNFDFPRPVSSGQLSFNGWLDSYQLQLQAEASAKGLPELRLELKGEGDQKHFEFERLQLQTDAGRVNAEGQLAWAPYLSWDLKVKADKFDPRPYLPEWPGEIAAQFATRGNLETGQLQARLTDLQLSGQLRDLALTGSGSLRLQDQTLTAEALQISLGANQLAANGSIPVGENPGAEMALDWSLQAPILSQLDPALGGSLSARGQLAGSLTEPRVKISARGEALHWQRDYKLEKFSLELNQVAASQYQLALHAQGLELADQMFQYLGLTGSGSLEAHQLHTRVISGAHGRLDWAVQGGWEAPGWQGELTQLELAPVALFPWHLTESVALVLKPEELRLGDLCLRPGERDWEGLTGPEASAPRAAEGQAAQICASAHWLPVEGTRAEGRIDGMPLVLLSRWLNPQLKLQGALDGQFSFRQPAQGTATGSLHMETRNAEVHYRYGEGDEDVYPLQLAELDANLNDNKLDSTFVTDWGDYGRARAELGLAVETGKLSGSVEASSSNLAPLEAFVPQLQDVAGNLGVDFTLSGDLADPQILGRADLTDASAKVPELGLDLNNIELHADSNADRITLTGGVSSGEGSLQLEGRLDQPGGPEWQLQASLKGERFLIANSSQITAQLSPDLSFKASAEAIRLEGSATVPKALIAIDTLPETATQISPDVVIKDPEGQVREADAGPPFFLDLRLILGDEVRFEGLGLEARLSGAISLLHTPERGLLTTGEVGVAEGTYTAYGQDLNIQRGRLIFQGPYDNPGLDIRAVREEDEVTAGLEIAGTLKRPRSDIFSSPSMSDSDAISVLFTGKRLSAEGSTSADASMLVNAIGGMGLERSGFITAEIADTFGLDEFTVQTEDDVTESSLRIGKYITPKLFVRYVVGLFNQTASFGLRYEFNKNLRLEAESGIYQSVDLIYKIERGDPQKGSEN